MRLKRQARIVEGAIVGCQWPALRPSTIDAVYHLAVRCAREAQCYLE